MPRPHYKLRGKIQLEGLEMNQIAKAIKKSNSYLSHRMNLKADFTLTDVVIICNTLKIPYCEIADYFIINV